jgi:hypothetical protein
MFVVGVILIIIYLTFDFTKIPNSDTLKAIIISFAVGIFVFILFMLISKLWIPKVYGKKGYEKSDKLLIFKIRKRKRINYIIGFILMIAAILLFLNFYLSFKALLGNDMLVSLKVDGENFVLKNGEGTQINIKAKVLTNPFCEANCSITLEDLSENRTIYYEDIYIKFSSPLSKDYFISSNSENSGQNLYKIYLECNTIKGKFCYINTNASKSRTKIISIDHELSDTQKIRKEELRNETENLNREIYRIQNGLNRLYLNSSIIDLSAFENQYQYLDNASYSLLNKVNDLNILYENQEYYQLETKVFSIKEEVKTLNSEFSELNSSFVNKIDTYNSLVNNVSSMYDSILYLQDYNFSNSSIANANLFINDFNAMILKLLEKNTVESKLKLFSNIELEKENIFFILENESSYGIAGKNTLKISIYTVNISKILLNEGLYNSNFTLYEPSPICCLNKECYQCIDNSSLNYPVILVHGHSFNEKLSAELSMEAFSGMANQLEKDGYINAGYFYGSQYDEISKAYLGRVNASVVVEATYYLNSSITEEGSFIFDSKWEDIDTYAKRLNEVVYNVKYLTGKDKVIIVAHSMGGLVTRRYMQLYGIDNVDKVILVGIPNHGVDGFVSNYCHVFGADVECSEMDKDSLFLAKLNNVTLPNIPIYNVIGLGCSWEGSLGDGIVKNESAYLQGTENIYVNGTCKGVDFFHVNMIKPSKYPEIYTLIKNLIK